MAMLVSGGVSIRDAAEIVNCAEQTGYNIARTTEFRQLVCELRTAQTGIAAGKLSKAATLAVDVLEEIAVDKKQTAAARVSAANSILSKLGPVTELGELRARLDVIERNGATK